MPQTHRRIVLSSIGGAILLLAGVLGGIFVSHRILGLGLTDSLGSYRDSYRECSRSLEDAQGELGELRDRVAEGLRHIEAGNRGIGESLGSIAGIRSATERNIILIGAIEKSLDEIEKAVAALQASSDSGSGGDGSDARVGTE